jgi:XRE family transcriptional regulator, regulator of sulfur utilization
MKAPVAVAFGRALRRLRHAAGLSQDALADKAGIDRTYPSLLERGLRAPTLAMLLKVAPGVGVSADTLLAETICELKAPHDARELERDG